ncbi:MAG: ChbG/HpnK family deacetylase [Candidatus Omnitrophica bacterium]|nr:ChbG/HpnK family deacetylase [Candidatus Omnitrophota bacterium]
MKKTIVLIHPPVDLGQRYGWLAFAGGIEPPLGLCFLAAALRERGFRAAIVDAQSLGLDIEDTLNLASRYDPDYIGITSVTSTISSAMKLAEGVKKMLPRAKVILGGCHVSALAEQAMRQCACFDIGVLGEGEATLSELLEALEGGKELFSVDGIVFRQGGQLFKTAPRRRIDDIDTLPFPAFDLLPGINSHYRVPLQSRAGGHSFSLIASRGCRGRCVFCDRGVFGNHLRLNSAEYIVDMVRYIYKRGVRCLIFEDDDFLVSSSRLARFRDLIRREGIDISWSCCTRMDTFDKDTLRIAKDAGCWQIMAGIESAEQAILDFSNKELNSEIVRGKINLAKESGIQIKAFLMFGNPGETAESLAKTTDFVLGLPLSDISITFFTPFPGADIWKNIGDYGSIIQSFDRFNCFEPVFLPKGISKDVLMKYYASALCRFYLRPQIIRNYLRRIMPSGTAARPGHKEKRLIVSAHDFGLSKGVNDGIIDSFKKGIVTNASVISCGKYSSEAINFLKANPDLKAGVHLCLTEERPILPGSEIPSLIMNDGRFRRSKWRLLAACISGRIKAGDIEREFQAQIARVKREGVEISYLDGHCYAHMLPGITDIVARLAQKYNISGIRLPHQSFWLIVKEAESNNLSRVIFQILLNLRCIILRKRWRRLGFYDTDDFMGFVSSGHLTENRLLKLLRSLKGGVTEVISHPADADDEMQKGYRGWRYDWEANKQALVSSRVKDAISKGGIGLGA